MRARFIMPFEHGMLLLLCLIVAVSRSDARPNIVLIIADDLGWNDVGFHGLNQIPTPNIDALAYSGLVLQNYYVLPICTPSRSALMTGKYPIHIGMQRGVIYGISQRGLPLSEKILPQYLKDLGYRTHLVGKWHLGHYKKEYLPLNRGFDSHTGFWTGKIDMYDHTNMETALWGHDFRRGFQVAYDLFGKYATDIYTTESIKVINAHNRSEPLFLMIAHSAVHSGNPNEPIRAPDNVIDNFTNIDNYQRRKFAGVLTKLDESVGKVVESLQKNGLLDNSIVIFTTDNGGPAQGFNDNAASNYPFKGVKNTLWEGGVRGAALVWSPLIKQRARVATQRMHIVDWLPTLLGAAGGNNSVFKDIDGINQWEALSEDRKSERRMLVHNIDDAEPSASITVDQWKIHKGTTYKGNWDSWYGPSGRDGTYDVEQVLNGHAGAAITKLALMPDEEKILQIRSAATIQCNTSIPMTACMPLKAPCLYNIEEDPCERNNLADQETEVLQTMLNHLDAMNKTAIPPQDNKLDQRGNPKYWGAVFTNFADYELANPTHVGAKPTEQATCL